jgi:hypothetical protein
MNLAACRTSHRLIYVAVLQRVFGGKALNAVTGFGAVVREERHADSISLCVTKWFDLNQFSKQATLEFKKATP